MTEPAPQIDLDAFVEEETNRLVLFALMWRYGISAAPAQFPATQTESEWRRAFNLFDQ